MSVTTFDTLKFTRHLKEAGVPEPQAEAQEEAISYAFSEALDAQVATKLDLLNLEKRIDSRFLELENKFGSRLSGLEKEFDTRIIGLEKSFDTKLVELEKRLDSRITNLEKSFHSGFAKLEKQMFVMQWMLGVVVAAIVLPLLKDLF